MNKNNPVNPATSIVGFWFHSFGPKDENGRTTVHWQGRVIAQVAPEFYLVQLYEWLMGSEGVLRLVPLMAMLDWHFYKTNEHMVDTYQDRYAWGSK